MLSKIRSCFGSENVNTGRQPELDMAKGLAIVFMIWTHVYEELAPQSEGIIVTLVRNILGGPFAAPVFMICLGIGICYSRNTSPAFLLRRGLGLLGMGLLLNLCRYVLPDLVLYGVLRNPKYLDDTFALFSVDILQFAGLAFIFLAAAKKLKLNNYHLAAIVVLASSLGMLLRNVSLGSFVADQFAGLLWGTATRTYFPFLNWIIFPIAGMIIGSLLKQCKDKKTFYLYVTPLFMAIMLVYLGLTIKFGFMFLSDGYYYFLSLFEALFFIVLAVMVFGWCYWILHLFPKVSFKPLMRWSKNINSMFCIHWTLIGFIGVAFTLLGKSSNLGVLQVVLITVALLILSDVLSAIYFENIKPKFAKIKQGDNHHDKN